MNTSGFKIHGPASTSARWVAAAVDSRGDEFHVAIIMDGNGRWARSRGRPRRAGHVAGTAAVRRTVEAAHGLGITTLTLYAFSADNWGRPRAEVDHLMHLLRSHLRSEADRLAERDVRLSVIGRRDRLPDALRRQIQAVEARTRSGSSMHLRLAVDYSAREAVLGAAALLAGIPAPSPESFGRALALAQNAPPGTRNVDLLVRTGGEKRLSDFLLWESAYAELFFTDTLWPDFGKDELALAVREFHARDRRFGTLSPAVGGGRAPSGHDRELERE